MKIAKIIYNLFLGALSAMKLNPSDYCDIETTDDYSTLVLKDRSMMTFVRYDGLLSTIDDQIFMQMVDHIDKQLTGLMSENGYKIGCIFRRDLEANSQLQKVRLLKKQTAKTLDLSMDDLIDEDINLYSNSVYGEEIYFCLITEPRVLEDIDLQVENEQRSKQVGPLMRDCQNLLTPVEVLRAKHISFVEKFVAAFSVEAFYTKLEVISVLDAISFIRHQVAPDRTSDNWLPSIPLGTANAEYLGIPNYHTPVRWSYTADPDDISYILPPPIPRQIMTSSINVYGVKEGLPKNTISVGGRLYSAFVMDIPPNQPIIFNGLFGSFNQSYSESASEEAGGNRRSMPYSVCYMISSDGMAGTSIKQMLTMFLAKVPKDTNMNVKAAFEQLNFLKRSKNEAIVGMQVSAMTWVEDTEIGRKELRTLKTRLATTLSSWGGMTVVENIGDPVMLFQSNILGLSKKHQGTKAVVPLARAIELLPLTRPASAFPNGTVLHRTLDNKLMPLEKFSSNMSAWVTVYAGRQGSGKSVSLNNHLLESCFMPNLKRLPLITVIDKGISSTGFIHLLSDGLPSNKRSQVVSRQLRKSKEYSINPFDIRPGLQFPLESERDQMITFLTALLTPNERKEPYEDTGAFVARLIDEVFLYYSETDASSAPKKYVSRVNSELDRIIIDNNVIKFKTKVVFNEDGEPIEEIDIAHPEDTTYLSLVRTMHRMAERYPYDSDEYLSLMRGRDLAQRYAVPILPDFAAILNKPTIKNTYKNKTPGGDSMVDYMLRTITDIQNSYPCFCNPTEFDVDTARVVALDLQHVISKNNKKQTSLFYQVARMVGIKKFSLTEYDLPRFNDSFQSYYQRMYENIKEDKKILAIDEMHNATDDMTFIKLVDTDVREGRKWGLELIFGSQRLTDFDFGTGEDDIQLLSGVTQLCLCSQISGSELATFRNFFSKNRAIEHILPSIGMSSQGLNFLSFTRTKNNEYCTPLNLPIGPKRLWSLTTDQEEMLLRDYMYEIAGTRRHAIAALSYIFKVGDAKERIREMQARLESKIQDRNEVKAIHANQVRDLARSILMSYDNYLAQQRQALLERDNYLMAS